MEELIRYTRALLLIHLKQLEISAEPGKGPAIRAEVLLAEAGFGAREIADLLGKNYAAVAKALSRARAAKSKAQLQEGIDAGGEHGQ